MADDARSPDVKGKTTNGPSRADWGTPLERLDHTWQDLEAKLCAAVIVVEIASLTLWVSLKGLSTDYTPGGNAAGLLMRIFISMTVLGLGAHFATRRQSEKVNRIAVSSAIAFGFFVGGRLWAHTGVHWASNLLNCLQNASVLMLVGGLRGLATRLTLWVALLGASLATSRGKHIHVDFLLRYVPAKLRAPTALVGSLAAATVCVFAVFGFVDYIGIANFRVAAMSPCPGDETKSCDTPTGVKLAGIEKEIGSDFFLLGRQLSLDVHSVPRALAGRPYDTWMSGQEWNDWLDGADWGAHFDKAAIDALHADTSMPGATHMPQVTVPGTGEDARGLLIRELNFVFPFGLAAIALKFFLRCLLVLSGHVRIDPDAEFEDEELVHTQERDDAAAKEAST
jgi:hypothetical protein